MPSAPRKASALAMHEPALARPDRRARGVYYTPPHVAQFLAERTLAAWRREDNHSPRVLDLACGAGALLQAIGEQLRDQGGRLARLVGVDRDPFTVDVARQELGRFAPELHIGDGLFAELGPPGSFDLIVGNPPYVNIRQAAKVGAADERARLANHFLYAKGSYDLYILFCERAWNLLAPNGVLGLIVPDKFGSASYAAAFRRRLLKESTIVEVYDLAQERVFRQAAVYPWMIVVRKQSASASHGVRFTRGQGNAAAPTVVCHQSRLSAEAFAFGAALRLEDRVSTAPLGSRATLACGATGYRAQRLAELLRESGDVSPTLSTRPFIVSGSIDPFVIKRQPVRYLRTTYDKPVIEKSAGLSAHQRALFARQKLVIAGLAQRIETAWDDVGRALGVQVFAAYGLVDDPFYLLGLLNSQLLSAIYRERFAARRLAGGYLTFNKGPLSKLPIRLLDDADRHDRQQAQALSAAAQELHELASQPDLTRFDDRRAELTAEIDAAALALYRISPAELADGDSAPQSAAA